MLAQTGFMMEVAINTISPLDHTAITFFIVLIEKSMRCNTNKNVPIITWSRASCRFFLFGFSHVCDSISGLKEVLKWLCLAAYTTFHCRFCTKKNYKEKGYWCGLLICFSNLTKSMRVRRWWETDWWGLRRWGYEKMLLIVASKTVLGFTICWRSVTASRLGCITCPSTRFLNFIMNS